MTRFDRYLLATSVLFFAGCATTDCDPSRGGFIRGIGCSVSGTYGGRSADLQNTLGVERAQGEALQKTYDQTSQERREVQGQRQAAERQYQALQRDLAAMQTKLAKAKAENKDLKRKISELQKQIKLLQADSFTPQPEKDARLVGLRKRKAELESQIDDALKR